MTSGTSYSPPPAFGRFRLLHQIGAGVLGPVFRTHDPDEDRLVAVKAFTLDLTPEQADQLAEELRRLITLDISHAYLAAPVDAGVEDSVAYLAQQYVTGESLDAAIRQYGPAPAADAARLISHVSEALDAGARIGVFHGALHPRDILVTPGETHLTGLGVALALEHVGVRAPVRRPYAAPEREQAGEWGAAADVFALAAIAHEVLTGNRALPGTEEPLPGLDDVKLPEGSGLRELLESALDTDPERRPATATDFATAFATALGLSGAAGAAPPAPGSRHRRRGRNKVAPKLPGLDEPLAPVAAEPAAPDPEPSPDLASPSEEEYSEVLPALAEPDPDAEAPSIEAPPIEAPEMEPSEFDALEARGRDSSAEPGMADLRLSLTPAPADVLRPEFSADFQELSEEIERYVRPERDVPGAREISLEVPTDQLPRGARTRDDAMMSVDDVRDPGTLLSEPPVPRALDPATASRSASPSRRVEPYRPLPPRERSLLGPVGAGLAAGLVLGLLLGYWLGGRGARLMPAPAPIASQPAAAIVPQPVVPTAPTAPAPAAPAPAAPAESRVGGIIVRSTPDKADVFVDGERQGVTPRNLVDLPYGSYTIRVTRPGYVPQERAVTLGPDNRNPRVTLTLVRAARARGGSPPAARPPGPRTTPPTAPPLRPAVVAGAVSIETRPPGARVRLDSRDVGVSPLVLGQVAVGNHTVRLELPGYKPWTTTIAVKAGERVRVAASLERSATR